MFREQTYKKEHLAG